MRKAIYPFRVGAGCWSDSQTYIDELQREWITEAGFARRFRLSHTIVRYCKQRINHQYISPPPVCRKGRGTATFPRPEVCVYAVEATDGKRLSARSFAASYQSTVCDNLKQGDERYEPQNELFKRFGITKAFCRYWSRRPSSRRGNDGCPALRTIPFAADVTIKGRRRGRLALYCLGDALAILRGKEAGHNITGHRAARGAAPLASSSIYKIIKEALADGAMTTAEVRSLAKAKRISKTQLRQAFEYWDIRQEQCGSGHNHLCYYCLPGQEPPRMEHAPGRKRVIDFLQGILADGQRHPRQEILAAANRIGICESQLYAALPFTDIVRERESQGNIRCGTWRLRKPTKTVGGSSCGAAEDSQMMPSVAREGGSLADIDPFPVRIVQPIEQPVPVRCEHCAGNKVPDDGAPAVGKNRGRGRPRSEKTADLYEACFDAYTKDKKLSASLRRLQREYGDKAPKDVSALRLYARRWAERTGLKLCRPDC